MTRQESNKLILKALEQYLDAASDIRFNQALHNLNIISVDRDSFYDEPAAVLERMTLLGDDHQV